MTRPIHTQREHDALLITNRLIEGAKENNDAPFTPMQLIKMVYIAHGWMLGLFGRSLIKQPVEAWKYGPVIADVYFAIKHYRNNPVDVTISGLSDEMFDDIESALIDKVRTAYGHFDGITLSSITHKPGTPWHQVVHRQRKAGRRVKIPNKLIERYYRRCVKENE